MVFFRGLVVGPSGSFHRLPAAVRLVLHKRCSLMENTANKAINPCREKCDFLMSLADLHTKVTWNEILFGVVTATRLRCPPVGACCCNRVTTVRRVPLGSPRTWEPYQTPSQPWLCSTMLPLFMCICSGENKLGIGGRQNSLLDI